MEESSDKRPPLCKNERMIKEMTIINSGKIQKCGQIFKPGTVRMAGNFMLGPVLGSTPARSMSQCLGRLKETDEFYTLKILTLKEGEESQEQGKMLLHTEHSLLSFLKDHPQIIKQHGLFEDYATDGDYNDKEIVSCGKFVRRIFLVLDCVIQHSYDPTSADFINLQHYVIRKKMLNELEALTIFYDIVAVVYDLHELNVIHRDLKLANVVLNKRTRRITLTNFCLGQHLVSENEKLLDQRGSPAYISPDVLSGKPYFGKPSDMWASGVLFFTMLFGQFPFYHKFHQELFQIIKSVQYSLPDDTFVKDDVTDIIKDLLCLQYKKRLTASQLLTRLTSVISSRLNPDIGPFNDAQIVPDMDMKRIKNEAKKSKKSKNCKKRLPNLSLSLDSGYSSELIELDSASTDSENDNRDILEYFREVPHGDSDESNVSRLETSYCFSTGNEDSHSFNTRTMNAPITIIEGDLRPFNQQDVSSFRDLFPNYSSSEFFGSWRKSSSAPNSPPHFLSSARVPIRQSLVPSSRFRSEVASGSSVGSLNCNPTNIFEFHPNRRINLTQRKNNSSQGVVPILTQEQVELNLDINSKKCLAGTSQDTPSTRRSKKKNISFGPISVLNSSNNGHIIVSNGVNSCESEESSSSAPSLDSFPSSSSILYGTSLPAGQYSRTSASSSCSPSINLSSPNASRMVSRKGILSKKLSNISVSQSTLGKNSSSYSKKEKTVATSNKVNSPSESGQKCAVITSADSNLQSSSNLILKSDLKRRSCVVSSKIDANGATIVLRSGKKLKINKPIVTNSDTFLSSSSDREIDSRDNKMNISSGKISNPKNNSLGKTIGVNRKNIRNVGVKIGANVEHSKSGTSKNYSNDIQIPSTSSYIEAEESLDDDVKKLRKTKRLKVSEGNSSSTPFKSVVVSKNKCVVWTKNSSMKNITSDNEFRNTSDMSDSASSTSTTDVKKDKSSDTNYLDSSNNYNSTNIEDKFNSKDKSNVSEVSLRDVNSDCDKGSNCNNTTKDGDDNNSTNDNYDSTSDNFNNFSLNFTDNHNLNYHINNNNREDANFRNLDANNNENEINNNENEINNNDLNNN